MRRRFASLLFIASLPAWLCVLPVSPAMAGAPTDQVRATVDKVVAIVNNPRLKPEAKSKERRDQLRQVIFARFDFTEMAKRSLGSYWRQLNPKQQDEFTRVFTDLLEHAYVSRIESYSGEKFVYTKELLDQDYAEVQSRIMTAKGEEFALNYKVRLVGPEWKVYDVVIENISLVNNYRSQFSRVITNSNYDELIRRMKEKQFDGASAKN